MNNTFKTKTTGNKDVAQGWNAEALRILLKDVKELQVIHLPEGFKVFGHNPVDGNPIDLVEDICDFTGWKNRKGYIGGKEFNPEFAKEVIGDFGLIVFGSRKRFNVHIVE